MIEVAGFRAGPMIGSMNAPLLTDPPRHGDMASKLRSLTIAKPPAMPDIGRSDPGVRRPHRRLAILAAVLLLPGRWALGQHLAPLLPQLSASPEPETPPLPAPAPAAPVLGRA